MTDFARSDWRPSAAEDKSHFSISAFLAKIRSGLPQRHHAFIIATGGLLNLTFVALGLHGAFGFSQELAFLSAAWLIVAQSALFEAGRKNGFVLNSLGRLFYAVVVAFNIVLAAGGITATFGADALGRNGFRESVREPLAAIFAVTEGTSNFAAAMARVAAHSNERHRAEVSEGGTCIASPRGNGPISRLREDDAAMFASLQQTMNALSARGRGIATAIDTQIANYSAARHQQAIAAISQALGSARELARDPEMANARRILQERAVQIQSGRPDRMDPGLRVFCPRDSMLGEAMAGALALDQPQIPAEFELPPEPNEATSVQGLFVGLLSLTLGRPADLGPWRGSLMTAWIPDALFLFGLALHARRRRALRTLDQDVADGWGLASLDLQADLERALKHPRVRELYASHIFEQGWLNTDWLAIPGDATARRRIAERLVRAKKAFDGGPCLGSELPRGAEGFDENATYYIFALRPGIWARLEGEAIRAALAAGADPNPSTPNHDGVAPEERAA